MLLDEQELRQQLTAAADQAGSPHVTVAAVTSRVRRRRSAILGLACGTALAVSAAIAVALPAALSSPSTPATGHPPPPLFRLSLTVTVNGHTRVFPRNGPPPAFTVTPGEHLRIRVGVGVPAHHEVTTLWLGVAGVLTAPGRDGRPPPGMRPILAHAREPLTGGPHAFRFAWTVPAQLPGTSRLLAAGWTTGQYDARVGQPVAVLVTPP